MLRRICNVTLNNPAQSCFRLRASDPANNVSKPNVTEQHVNNHVTEQHVRKPSRYVSIATEDANE